MWVGRGLALQGSNFGLLRRANHKLLASFQTLKGSLAILRPSKLQASTFLDRDFALACDNITYSFSFFGNMHNLPSGEGHTDPHTALRRIIDHSC